MPFKLPPHQQLAALGKWPVVGERAPRQSREPWAVRIDGLVSNPRTWSLDDLLAMPHVEREIDVHCVTRWSKPAMRFGGVPLRKLLGACRPDETAAYISFGARSERGHETSLRLADALELDTLVAFSQDGAPLDEIHGGPVRTVVPGRYFYKSLKWLERIELLEHDRLGYWEAETGYHNVADPFREERYAAPSLDRVTAKRVIESRDFEGLDLRSLDAENRDLEGLDARNAILRDASFRRARLGGALFDGANLSNAHLENADLRHASFLRADVEGADFSGADLSGADFRGASLFGASFVDETGDVAARIDASTKIDAASLEQLTPKQAEYVASRRAGADSGSE
jgi:hypothetical protein